MSSHSTTSWYQSSGERIRVLEEMLTKAKSRLAAKDVELKLVLGGWEAQVRVANALEERLREAEEGRPAAVDCATDVPELAGLSLPGGMAFSGGEVPPAVRLAYRWYLRSSQRLARLRQGEGQDGTYYPSIRPAKARAMAARGMSLGTVAGVAEAVRSRLLDRTDRLLSQQEAALGEEVRIASGRAAEAERRLAELTVQMEEGRAALVAAEESASALRAEVEGERGRVLEEAEGAGRAALEDARKEAEILISKADTRAERAEGRAAEAEARAERAELMATDAKAWAEGQAAEAETRAVQAQDRIAQMEGQIAQDKNRGDVAEARAEQAEARAEEVKARAEQAEARAEQAEARAEQAEARAEQAEARAEQAEARAEQAEARAEQAEAQATEVQAHAHSGPQRAPETSGHEDDNAPHSENPSHDAGHPDVTMQETTSLRRELESKVAEAEAEAEAAMQRATDLEAQLASEREDHEKLEEIVTAKMTELVIAKEEMAAEVQRLQGELRVQTAKGLKLQERLGQVEEAGIQSLQLPASAPPHALPFAAEVVRLAEGGETEDETHHGHPLALEPDQSLPGDSAVKAAAFEDPGALHFDWDLLSVESSPKAVPSEEETITHNVSSEDGVENLVNF